MIPSLNLGMIYQCPSCDTPSYYQGCGLCSSILWAYFAGELDVLPGFLGGPPDLKELAKTIELEAMYQIQRTQGETKSDFLSWMTLND